MPPGLVVPTAGASPEGVLTITQLAARIDAALKGGVPGRVKVVGEISNVSNRTHWYFSLKDEGALIAAVAFASTARKLRVLPTQGDRVIATGRLDFFAPSGRVSLIVDELEPVGQGSLERELKARVEALRERGWLDPESKRPLPAFPRAIGVVTSKDGAAVQDIIDTARRRCPAVTLRIVDVRVQGERAATEVAEAVRLLSAHARRLGIDAILVTRGGGSLEDLWAFNELPVAEAIRNATVPVVAAIGHETDTTIAELVADWRAATPTQAAMRLIPDRVALEEQLDAQSRRIATAARQHAIAERKRLSMLANRPSLRDPARVLDAHHDRLVSLIRRLDGAARARVLHAERRLHRAASRLERHRPGVIQARREESLNAMQDRLARAVRTRLRLGAESLDALHRELHAVGPDQVLARGFSVTTTADGRLVREPAQVRPGDELLTRLRSGTVRSGVLGQSENAEQPPPTPERPSARPPARGSKPAPRDDRQMGLF
jgi:exodeoxyribonuclease VII large subunit